MQADGDIDLFRLAAGDMALQLPVELVEQAQPLAAAPAMAQGSPSQMRMVRGGGSPPSGKRKPRSRSISPVSRSAWAKAGQATRRERKPMLFATPTTR